MPTSEVSGHTIQAQSKKSTCFVDWIPNNVKMALDDIPHEGCKCVRSLLAVKQQYSTCLCESWRSLRPCFAS
uniref:Tubulin_C domain-containing protein n=1 Tax=Ascaris lumbricoides TaxID=6252 RepID=A0A0M3HN69_ASCLU